MNAKFAVVDGRSQTGNESGDPPNALIVDAHSGYCVGFFLSFWGTGLAATFCGLRYVGVPLREDFTLDVEATVAAIRESKPAVTFLAYPNNPTGNLFNRDAREPSPAPGQIPNDYPLPRRTVQLELGYGF